MKHLFLACCLLFSVGVPLQAQTTTLPVPSTRYYTGTMQQYSATGQMSSGVCAIQVDPHGKIEVQASINGSVVTYFGHLEPYPERTGTGYVYAVDEQLLPLANPYKIPLLVKGSTVSGGALNEDATSLVFRGTRSGTLPDLN